MTGGAGFIGSNMVNRLLELGADVVVVDKLQLSSGSLAWNKKLLRLEEIFRKNGISKIPLEICDLEVDKQRFQIIAQSVDVVFHLSAVFGGREFVNTRQADCSKMLAIDHNTIDAAHEAGVERFHFASSACVYGDSLQKDPKYLLKEDDILSTGDGWQSSDNLYGFAKLLGELQGIVYHKEKGLKTSTARYLTVYGPGEFDTSHAISALIERSLDQADPFTVWGSGCLPPDEMVFAGGHYSRIAELQAGDSVEDHTGGFQSVSNTFRRHYEGQVLKIKAMGLKALSLTPEHLVLVAKLGTYCKVGRPHYCKPNCFCTNYKIYHRHGHSESDPRVRVEWIRADSLRPTVESGEYLIFPKLRIHGDKAVVRLDQYRSPKSNFRRELYNDIIVDRDFAFLLGWYTAEGWTGWHKANRGKKSKGSVNMALGPSEKWIGLKLAKIARARGFSPYIRTKRRAKKRHKRTFEIGFAGTGLAKWLNANVGRGARRKRIPSIIFHAPEEIIRSYFDGLYMGDGSKSKYGARLTSTSSELLLDSQVLLSAVGKFGMVNLPTNEQAWGVLDWYNEKYNKYWQDSANIYTPIMSIISVPYKGAVHDIQTKDHTFATPVLVHNSQQRGFTYVSDIVAGSILACEKIADGTPVNLGWDKRYKIRDVAKMILDITQHRPKVVFDRTKPEGPFSRALDIRRAKKMLGWEPKIDLHEGLEKTIDWHKGQRAAPVVQKHQKA